MVIASMYPASKIVINLIKCIWIGILKSTNVEYIEVCFIQMQLILEH